MFDLFGCPWDQVDLQRVRDFFDEAGEEGVTWEAKADDERGGLRPDSIRKAACGLANQIGGYLFLGARHTEGQDWTLPGIEIADPEPKLWIEKIIGRLQPRPRVDPKTWTLTDGRVIAVIRIQPVAAPPCMTPNGRVYERVSSETLPVEDPVLLDALFRRGEAARERAELSALRAARRALEAPGWWPQRSVGLAVAAAPIGRETDDIGARLFNAPTRQAITEATWALIKALRPVGDPDEVTPLQEQDAYTVLGHFTERQHFGVDNRVLCLYRSTWLVQTGWDGSVAAALTFNDGDVSQAPPAAEMFGACRRVIDPLLSRLGGYGPAHLTAVLATTKTSQPLVRDQAVHAPGRPPASDTLYARLDETTQMDRWIEVGDVDDEISASLERELKRAAGVIEDEPASAT